MGAEEDGDPAVRILMHAHARLDEVGPQRAWRDLQAEPAPFDGNVVADLAGFLDAQKLARDPEGIGDEGRARLLGCHREARVMGGDVAPGEPAVGGLEGGDAGEPELLGQPVLERAEGPVPIANSMSSEW
jgi:hypothetical protein